jgi:beta-phosphoglucomutase family hydrolase
MIVSPSELWTAPASTTALIFDCDGTLADTMPTHYVAWTTMLADHGIPFSEQRFYELAGMPSDRIVELLSEESGVAVGDVVAMVDTKESLYLQSIAAMRRIEVVCDIALRHHRLLPLAVASGGERAIVNATIEAIGLTDIFDAVVGAEDTELHKPEPDVFLEAARRLGVEPAGCVVFEDSDLGLLAAARAGMTGIDIRPWLLTGSEGPPA